MKMKYLYMSFLLALVYSCSDSGDNSDYSEMLKKDFNQENIRNVMEKVFKTDTGKTLLQGIYLSDFPSTFNRE